MASTENRNLDFARILNADLAFISANITKEHAFNICAYAVENEQVTASEVLNFWTSKLRILFVFEDFCEVDWRRLTVCCQNYFQKYVYNQREDDGTYYKFRCWLEATKIFLFRVRTVAKELNLTGICLFLTFILDTVGKCCIYFRINAGKIDWKSQVEIINCLIITLLQLVWDCLKGSGDISGNDYCGIIPFINMMCLSATQNSFLDVKTKVEIWKYLAKFTLAYAEYENNLREPVWPQMQMSVLIQEVKSNILVIYKKEFKEDIQYVEQYLRVTGFYVKILHRMTTAFQHSNFPIAKEFFELLLVTMTAPSSLQKSTISISLKKHVLPGLIDLLSLVFKNNDFLQLVSKHVGENAVPCCDLVVAYLNACILNDCSDFFASNAVLFTKIFTQLFQGGVIFVDADHFDKIIDIYASLILLDRTQSFFRNMQPFVVKGNIALSFACTEVLILASSCVDAVDMLIIELVYWIQTRNRFARFSSNFKCLNVDRLISHYFTLCLGKISKSEIQARLSDCVSSFNNCNILRYIKDGSNKHELESISSIVGSKLCRLIEAYERNGMRREEYYEIVDCMYELSSYKANISTGLQQKITNLLVKVCQTFLKNGKISFKLFLRAGFALMSNINITDQTQLKLLGVMNDAVASRANLNMVAFWVILEVCCKQQKDAKIHTTAQSIFVRLEVPDIIQVSVFEKSSPTTHAVDPNYYNYIENKNECVICLSPYFVQRKRRRNEVDYEEGDLEEIIQTVEHMVTKIHDFSKRLNENHVEKLNNICSNLKIITNDHKKSK